MYNSTSSSTPRAGPALPTRTTRRPSRRSTRTRTCCSSATCLRAMQDIETYAGWPAACGLAGIFFDETQAGLTQTYTAYTDTARNATWPGRTTAYVILNPGEDIGASDYYTFADQIVTFENTYAQYQNQAPLPLPHPVQQSVIINSFNGTSETLASVVQAFETSGLASAYITDLDVDIYKSFGRDWTVFVQDVNTESGSGVSR
ncbi:Spherulin-4 [Mycena venus]|uniref:Spherulin-4 n=1 Tax=Mycena venus TaxID=2733690 RepID=A0A8H6Z4S9_9AGAR|nr:Spherulin-4 [Mycena venus]